MSISKHLRDGLIGKEVICRTNENDPLIRAVLIRFELHENSGKYFPWYKDINTGEEFMFNGITIPYTYTMWSLMDNIPNSLCYSIFRDMSVFREDLQTAIENGV